MRSPLLAAPAAWLLLAVSALAQPPTFERPRYYMPTDEERASIQAGIDELARTVDELRTRPGAADPRTGEPLADVEVCLKAARWIVRFGEFFESGDVGRTLKVLDLGCRRAAEIGAGRPSWARARGSVGRGFVSKVDGSVQPYAVVVPESYDPDGEARARLDVVLHGRDGRLNEVRFLNAHDGKSAPADAPGLVLHVYGRGNNAYRWAGETDVFEAIDAVKRNYRVDERRIVLRGFSMGGAGAWHLGLHHPSRWCSVEAGAGFTDTRKYLGRDQFPAREEPGLHIYDAVDYALNATNVPIVGYGGEEDKQLQASTNIVEALRSLGFDLKTEGLVTRGADIDFLRLVGPKMGHQVDPASAERMREFHNEHAARGLDLMPKRIRFATFSLKYSRAPWLSVERLIEHYRPATVDAEIKDDAVEVKAENIAVLAVDREAGQTIRFGDQEFPLRLAVKGLLPQVYFRKREAGWVALDYEESRALQDGNDRFKRPGLQGPIDDAFTGAFLCVRGTGAGWNPKVQEWAEGERKRFAETWARWMRADLPVKDDAEVTEDDIQSRNLVLFGDPASNRLIRRVLDRLPLRWTESDLVLGGTYSSADYAPALIAPNPLSRYHYVVINSGHTFGADAFEGTNALLYPRFGDFAVFKIGERPCALARAGYFDEGWKPK